MKKYLIAIPLILIFSVILVYGYVNNSNQPLNPSFDNSTKTYSANGISFKYPLDWQKVNKNGQYVIAYVKDPKVNNTDGKPGAVVEIQKKASNGIPLERFYDEFKFGASSTPGYQQLSESIIEVDNLTAYELTASGSDNGIQDQFEVVLFEKEGYIYMIACGTRAPTYLTDEENNFNLIIDSFKIQ